MSFNLYLNIYALDESGRRIDILSSSKSVGGRKPASYYFAGELTQQVDEDFIGFVLNELIATMNGDYGFQIPLLEKCDECGNWVDERHIGYPKEGIYDENGQLIDLREKSICFECLSKQRE